ncbi:hypothetical protein [Brevibacillus sp. SAFN-007a]|uniref:hypothetical protein n=1 Tax=Brevibacillus sp. SAFN-007a TaxID=3436862 RepID=UPI003F7F2C2F
MNKEIVEIPQTDIPDEVRQVDLPEIGETTPHPKPESPLASHGRDSGETAGPIGFQP